MGESPHSYEYNALPAHERRLNLLITASFWCCSTEYLVKDYLKHRKEQVFSLSSATVTIQNLLIFQGVIYLLHEAFLTLKDSFLY